MLSIINPADLRGFKVATAGCKAAESATGASARENERPLGFLRGQVRRAYRFEPSRIVLSVLADSAARNDRGMPAGGLLGEACKVGTLHDREDKEGDEEETLVAGLYLVAAGGIARGIDRP